MTNFDDNGDQQRALFIDTTLNTHLILLVSPLDTFSHLKQKILLEHPKCFPDFGDIEVNAVKVKRKGIYYHTVDSMLVKVAFHGVSTNWFLSVDVSSKTATAETPNDGHAINPAMLIEPPATLVDSPKLWMNNCHSDDLLGTNSHKIENKSQPEMPNILTIYKAHDECNPSENSLQPGSRCAEKLKKRKRKRSNTGGDGDVESLDLHGRIETTVFDESLAEERQLVSVGNETNIENIVDEISPTSLIVKKKLKVANDDARENPLMDSKFSDPNRSTSEPENIIDKSGLVDLNELSSEAPKTFKVSRKEKKGKRHVDHEPMNSDIKGNGNKKNASIVENVAKESFQLEAEDFNNEKGSDDVGLTSGSRAKKTKKAKKGDADILKDDVSLSANENRINDGEHCNTKVTGLEKTKQEPVTSTKRQIEEESTPLKSSKMKGIDESENTGKKKKSRKSKRSVTEKSELCSTENHQGVANAGPTSEVEDASEVDKEKPVNEHVEVGKMAKKKKTKKGKNSSVEKTNLSIKENNEDYNKHEVADVSHINVTSDTNISSQADDVQKIGAESSQPSEIEKLGEDVQVVTDDIIIKVCKDLTGPSKDHLERGSEEQLGEKIGEPQVDANVSDIDVNATQEQRDEGRHEEMIPCAEIFTGSAEAENLKKQPESTKKGAKTNKITSSVATTSVGGNDKTENATPLEGGEEASEVVPKSKLAFGDFMEDTGDNDSKHQREVSGGKNLCKKFNDMPTPEVSDDVMNSAKPQESKKRAKKLDFPSSEDISSGGPDLTKSQKHKGTERIPKDVPELSSKQRMKTQGHNPLKSESKLSSRASSVSSGNSFRIKGPTEKAKPVINASSKKSVHKKMGQVANSVTKRKGLVTPGAIFEDESDASSDEDETYVSGSSTRTPSDYVSSSDYSEGESEVVVNSQHDSLKDGGATANSKSISDLKRLDLGSILRSSSRFKKAKVIASQMEDSEIQPIDFVPDSQLN